jgi:hypothetical protein
MVGVGDSAFALRNCLGVFTFRCRFGHLRAPRTRAALAKIKAGALFYHLPWLGFRFAERLLVGSAGVAPRRCFPSIKKGGTNPKLAPFAPDERCVFLRAVLLRHAFFREAQPGVKNVVAFRLCYSGARLFAPPQDVDEMFMLHLCHRGLVTVRSLSLYRWT